MCKISEIKTNFIRLLFCFMMLNDTCISMKPECISDECWNSYTKTWISFQGITPETGNIHKKMAYRVILAVKKDVPDLGFSNVASFSLCIKYKDGSFVDLPLPFVVTSCDVSATEDSFAYYWQYNGEYMPIISVNSFFQSSPSYGFSTTHATMSFVKRIMEAQEKGVYGEENWQLIKALTLLHDRVKSRSYFSHMINPVGVETGESNDILRSVLHCEQVVIDRIITDDGFLDLFLGQLKAKGEEIVGIDFHIDTYNDMCHKCFSTCKHRKIDLLRRIVERLKFLGHNVRGISHDEFRFLISSHREYKIPGSGYKTGGVLDGSCCEMESIFQFRNAGNDEALTRIASIDKARSRKCAEIDKLFEQIKAMGISVSSGKSPIAEKKYSEQVISIRKSLKGKKDRTLPSGCSSGPVYEEIQAENRYLATLRTCVEQVLMSIEQKIGELFALHYFLTTDELRALGCSK